MADARPRSLLLVALAVGSLLWLGPPGLAADAPAPVVVTNLPDVQPVSGEVSVVEPVPAVKFGTKSAVVAIHLIAGPTGVGAEVAAPLELGAEDPSWPARRR